MDWAPGSWRRFEARQQPDYPDPAAFEAACAELARRPPLVDLAAIDDLTNALAGAQTGRAFLLHGGDCAERLSDGPDDAQAMAALIADLTSEIATAGLPVVTIGRIAGQFAKPRSQAEETRDGRSLPAWRGDSVNDMVFDAAARTPDPRRLLQAHDHAAQTIAALAARPLYTSHEALLLPVEEALVHPDGGRWFGGSAHFLWIGARTLFANSAHVELLRGLANPLGVKCDAVLGADELLAILDRLNPDHIAGRITLIVRMGCERVEEGLPRLLAAVAVSRHPVLWCCDPLHGNTRHGADGRKQRRLAEVEGEARAFFDIVAAAGAYAGGLHLEMTGADVAECDDDTGDCSRDRDECRDPRLNPDQARRIAKLAATRIARCRPALTPA